MTCIILQNTKVGDKVRFSCYGTKWTVEERKEPRRELSYGGGGYIALRTARGTYKVIGHRFWDMPVTIVERNEMTDLTNIMVDARDPDMINVGSNVVSEKGILIRLESLLERCNIAKLDRVAIRVAIALIKTRGCEYCSGYAVLPHGILAGHPCSCQE